MCCWPATLLMLPDNIEAVDREWFTPGMFSKSYFFWNLRSMILLCVTTATINWKMKWRIVFFDVCYCFYTNCNHKVAPPHIIIVNTIIIGSNYPHLLSLQKSINHGDFVQLNVPLMETNHGWMSYTWIYNQRHSHSAESLKSRNPREMLDMAVSKTKTNIEMSWVDLWLTLMPQQEGTTLHRQ